MKIFVLILSLIIVGEALILFFGSFVSKTGPAWRNTRNIILIMIDTITGLGMIYSGYEFNLAGNILFTELLAAALIAHILRTLEYFSNRKIKFCFNLPLFYINNLKLAAILVLFYFILF